MEQLGFQAVIGDLQGYLAGAAKITAANEAAAKSAIAAANAAVKQSDALVTQASAASKAAVGTDAAAAADEKLAAAQVQATAAHNNASVAIAKSDSALTKMAGSLKAAAVSAGLMIGAFVGFKILDSAISKTQELGNETYTLQRITGMTAEQISALLYAGDKLGVGYDKLSAGLRIFSRNMAVVQEANDGFTGGAKTTSEILQSMGIKVLDLNGKLRPTADLLADVSDWFAHTADGAVKTGLAAQLFSRNGAAMLPILNLGAQGMKDVTAEAEKLHLVLTQKNVNSIHQFTIAQNDAKAALGGLAVSLGTVLLPILTRFFDLVTGHQREVGIALAAIAAGFVGIGVAAVAAAIATNAALAGIPILLAALVAGTVYVVENWKELKAEAESIWGGMPGPIKAFLSFIESDVVSRIKGGIGVILDVFHILRQGIKVVMDLISGDWSKAWTDFKAIGGMAAKAAGDSILNVFGAWANLFIKIFQDAVNKAIDALDSLSGKVNVPGLGNINPLSGLNIGHVDLGQIQSQSIDLQGILGKVGDAFSSLGSKAGDTKPGLDDTTGGLDAIPPAADAAASSIKSLADTLAGAALSAVKAAQSALFAAQTQEEAAMTMAQAVAHLHQVEVEQANAGSLSSLQDQLSGLQDQEDAASASDSAAADRAKATKDAADQAAKDAEQARQDAHDQADAQQQAIKDAAEQAAHAAAAIVDKLNQQLEALQKNASDLQTAFVKRDEALQQQINAAIGRGDTGGAMQLVGQQKTLTSQYRQDSAANTAQQAQQVSAIKDAQRNAQAVADMAAAVKSSVPALKAATAEKVVETKATATQTETLKASEKAVQKQIDAIEKQNKQAGEAYEAASKSLELEKAKKDVLQASIAVQNHALLTDAEQATAAHDLAGMMDEASTAVRGAAESTGKSLIPEIDLAKQALSDMRQYGADMSTEALKKLTDAASAAVNPLQQLAGGVTAAAKAAYAAARSLKEAQDKANEDITGQVHPGGGGYSAEGGIFNRPTLTWVGETFQKEAIVPLERPRRAREVLSSLPASVLAAIMPQRAGRGGPMSVFGDLNVQGSTLEDMEQMAHRAIDSVFRGARTGARAQGSLLLQGIGSGAPV